jgi:sortase A
MAVTTRLRGEHGAKAPIALLFLRWTRRVLLFAGFALLAWCVYVIIDARVFQERENRVLDQLLKKKAREPVPAPALVAKPVVTPPAAAKPPAPALVKGLLGRIEVPRLGLSTIVIEGSDAVVLRRAVGHIPGTAMPGEPGNAAITGHRDTFFRPLRNIRKNDLIRFTTLQGEYEYRVVSLSVVSPEFAEVLRSDGDEVLTLITCYPFYFVGAAPRRFVVRAERIQF